MSLLRHKPYESQRFLPPRLTEEAAGKTLAVPGYRQSRNYSCGYTSALMVARFFDAPIGAAELFARLGTGRDGTRQSAIVRELRSVGIRANIRYDVDFDRLSTAIDRDKVVIGYLFDIEHWLVVYGYTRAPDRVFVADPRPDEPCLHSWDTYGPRLGAFGIVCSVPARRPGPEKSAAEPEALENQLNFEF